MTDRSGQANEQDIFEHSGYVPNSDSTDFTMTATYTREEARYRFADAMIKERTK